MTKISTCAIFFPFVWKVKAVDIIIFSTTQVGSEVAWPSDACTDSLKANTCNVGRGGPRFTRLDQEVQHGDLNNVCGRGGS